MHSSGASRREDERTSGFFVIASAAKQSMAATKRKMDCFAALAMTVSKLRMIRLFEI
jgi:hypothetical protein